MPVSSANARKARLKGHEFDLRTLAELFREGDTAVATDQEGYYFSFTAPTASLTMARGCTTLRLCCFAGSTAWPGHSAATFGRWA
jgi:hypothetical protein